jgi:hypothetical protein
MEATARALASGLVTAHELRTAAQPCSTRARRLVERAIEATAGRA